MKTKNIHQVNEWRGVYRDIGFRVSRHTSEGLRDNYPSGCWCYYIYLPEAKTVNFDELWLEDKLVRYSPSSPERVTHDYYGCPRVSQIELHGGITYYAKHGHTPGHRIVEVGCDYQHLNDLEQVYCAEHLVADAEDTIDWLYTNGYFSTST